MARLFCIPGSVLLFAAFILNLIVTISLPYLPVLDITRTHFDNGARTNSDLLMTEMRFGIWTRCFYDNEGDRTCPPLGYAYDVTVSDTSRSNQVQVTAPWTRGLALHPLATIVSLLAFAFALSEHVTVALVATLTAWLASFLTFVAFIIDLILFGWSKHQFKRLDIGARTNTAPDRRAQRKAADAATVEAAHKHATHDREATAATAVTHSDAPATKVDSTTEKVDTEKAGGEGTSKDAGADVGRAGPKPFGWARKFKFGEKA